VAIVLLTRLPGEVKARMLAVFANQDLFPAEQPRQDGKAKKKTPAAQD